MKTNQGYTKGPWQIQVTGGESEVVTGSELGLAAVINGPTYETRNANARLIASAPDLLNAAKKSLKAHTRGYQAMNQGGNPIPCSCSGCDGLRVAIAKAEGK